MALRMTPSRNPRIVGQWLAQVTQMVQAVRDVGLPPFGGVSDITAELERAIPGGTGGGEDFAKIAGVLEGAANIKSYLNSLGEDMTLLHELAGGIAEFSSQIEAIRLVVGSGGEILDSASPKLGQVRRQIDAIDHQIRDTIHSYLRQKEVAKLLQNPTVTVHGDRYVLPVKVENRGRLPGVVHRESKTGATVFVEPNASVELNNKLADLREDERREIRLLLNQLAVIVQTRKADIVSTLRMLGQIDLLSAKAQYSYQFDMVCPEITERGPLQFNQARHPLLLEQLHQQEQQQLPAEELHAVVPIDIRLGSDFDLLVITGSNTGGKTVTLKATALLALMAQSGMHIPAQRGATLPVFRNIFIDVGDEQSLQQSLSTFGAHVKRVKYILREADRNSLVLLDELGAGTDPDEGGAIGQAILDELRRIGCCGMVTTHLSILKAYAINNERVDNASVEFDTATLSPTYHLRIGTPGESHAIAVAKKLGMPRRITAAARQHLDSQGKQFRKAMRATGAARQVAEEARKQAHTEQMEAESRQEVYQSKLADLHRLQEEFEMWLANLPSLAPGDEIFVPSLNKTGKLVRLELHRQQAVVDTGNMNVEVPLKELMPDLGQSGVREQIASLRRQILDQASATEEARTDSARIQAEYQRSLNQQKLHAKQFDQWLEAIGRLKVGDVVPVAHKIGSAKVLKVDLAGLKVTCQSGDGELVLPLQDIFPQTGPFAKKSHKPSHKHRKGKPQSAPAKPMQRHKTSPKADKSNRQALLKLEPGTQVFVVPFNKTATLIRISPGKGTATVQSGIFEMEIPLSDLRTL